LLDTTHQVVMTHSMYLYVVTFYGNLARESIINSTAIAEYAITAFSALLVQLFFVFRAWRLSGRNYIIAVVLLVLSLAAVVVLLVFSFELARQPTYQHVAKLKIPSESRKQLWNILGRLRSQHIRGTNILPLPLSTGFLEI